MHIESLIQRPAKFPLQLRHSCLRPDHKNKILKRMGGLKETHGLSGSLAVDRLCLGEVSNVVGVEFGPQFGQLLVGFKVLDGRTH
jgi:hypothetical protein